MQMQLQPVKQTMGRQPIVIQSQKGTRLRDIVGYSFAVRLASFTVGRDVRLDTLFVSDCSSILYLVGEPLRLYTRLLMRRRVLRWPGIKSGSMSLLRLEKKGTY